MAELRWYRGLSALRGGEGFFIEEKERDNMDRMVIVGSGNLAHALWEGWQRLPAWPREYALLIRSEAHRSLWPDNVWNLASQDVGIVSNADYIVLAVKPKDAPKALAAITPRLQEHTLVISPMAGWSIDRIRESGVKGAVIRVMPNVCAAIGASMTLATEDGMSPAQKQKVLQLLQELGPVTVVEESLMNPYTALVGSGPAYIFLLLEALIEGGIRLGADAQRTRQLVSYMVEGAARLARDRSRDSLDQWIGQVASPGGTTEASLSVLKSANWPAVLSDAVVAAGQKAMELGGVAR